MSMSVVISISFNEGEYQWMPTTIFKLNIWNVFTLYLIIYNYNKKRQNDLFMDLSKITFDFNLKRIIVLGSILDQSWNVNLKIYN